MLKQIRRFSELERPARELFLQASVLLPLVSISVQWFGFPDPNLLVRIRFGVAGYQVGRTWGGKGFASFNGERFE